MSEYLESLARSHGIQTHYKAETGEERVLSETAIRSLLRVMNVDPEEPVAGHFESGRHAPSLACIAPDAQRHWGLTCQLYSLRSKRTLGFGDFEDLARLAEIAGHAGAAFLGVNPLHALFLANPGHFSPYSPSTRRFLNPFYIAIDQLPGGDAAIAALKSIDPTIYDGLDEPLIDYQRAGNAKVRLLRYLFENGAVDTDGLAAFQAEQGEPLRQFALFEAISCYVETGGGGAGWYAWPDALRHVHGSAVAAFAEQNADEVRFHTWLQYVANAQLRAAQQRAKAAGMRIGLYLDLAVGVAPDGAETWVDPGVTVHDARVGAPPDMFNSAGQDWGLAPLSPEGLALRDYQPLAAAYKTLMQHAGAVRIDHVMGLARLWWIARGHSATEGGYVRYPLGDMVDVAARASQENQCLVIGEDLGTVPDGFRPVMEAANMLSYRVLYFEKRMWEGFIPPAHYPPKSLACISTHDLATLAGWWKGNDIALRAETGRQDDAATERDRTERDNDRRALLHALRQENLLPGVLHEPLDHGAPLPETMDIDLAICIHRFAARTQSHLFAAQVEDFVLAENQPNLPGTTDEYPNWRIRSAVSLDALAEHPVFVAMAAAMREERPEAS